MAAVGKHKDEKSSDSERVAVKQGKKPVHSGSGSGGHKKVFDVVRPGKTPASATSRPVPASQKPPVADDQFVATKTAPMLRASDPHTKHDLMDSKSKKSVAPLGDTVDTDESENTPKPEANGSRPADSGPAEAAATAPMLSRLKGVNARTNSDTQPAAQGPDSVVPVTAPAAEPSPKTAPSFLDDDPNAIPIWEMEDEPTPAHLAMEQVVDADDGIESHHVRGRVAPDSVVGEGRVDAPGPSSTIASDASSTGVGSPSSGAKTIDQLLAETGAPNLGTDDQPGLIISHHKTHSRWGMFFLILLTGVVLAVIAADLLLDAGYIDTSFEVPHTDFL